MSKGISFLVLLAFGLLSLSAFALTPTVDKSLFFVNSNNFLSQELFQTKNGVIAHNIQYINGVETSQYVLLDILSKAATPIFADTVAACEIGPAVFQHLHYHVASDSLVYFCPKNSTLLVINQYSPTLAVQSSVFLNLGGTWPVAKLSTQGNNIVILAMDSFSAATPKNSILVKVTASTKRAATPIVLNTGLATNENVVAFASSKYASYIATNKIDGTTLTTTIYNLTTVGSRYTLTSLSSFTNTAATRVITKLFCLGDLVVTNNGQDLYFIDQPGSATQKGQLRLKNLALYSQNQLSQPFLTVISDGLGTYLYAVSSLSSADRYSIVDSAIVTKSLGNFAEIQVAYGNKTAADLMFALDFPRITFSMINLQTELTTFSTLAGYDDLMLTNFTYAIVKADSDGVFNLNRFDLRDDGLIQTVPIGQKYYYNKDQYTVSYLNNTATSGCWLQHIDLITGRYWTTLKFAAENEICTSWVYFLNMTEKGYPQVVLPFADKYLIITEKWGQITFPTTSSLTVDFDSLNINFDDMSLYYLIADLSSIQTRASFYTYNAVSQSFIFRSFSFWNVLFTQSKGFFTVNTHLTVGLSASALTFFDGLLTPVSLPLPTGWNLVTGFQDFNGTQYVIGTYANSASPRGAYPALFAINGDAITLPGFNTNTVRAQAAGPKSYFVHDDLYSAFGIIRFYNAAKPTGQSSPFIAIAK